MAEYTCPSCGGIDCFRPPPTSVVGRKNYVAQPPDERPDVDEAVDAITKIVFERYDRGEGKTGGEPFRLALQVELARIIASRPAREAVREDVLNAANRIFRDVRRGVYKNEEASVVAEFILHLAGRTADANTGGK